MFLGITAYSLQNHLRTTIVNYGQIEIDELYVGVDSRGAQYIVPVQAKGGNDVLGVIQTIQDTVFCETEERYGDCVARPVSAQFMADDVRERHYRLTEAGGIQSDELRRYRLSEPD